MTRTKAAAVFVNAYEDAMSKSAMQTMYDRIFRTKMGKYYYNQRIAERDVLSVIRKSLLDIAYNTKIHWFGRR